MPPLTPARAGLMRSGAGRAGWPILQGVTVPLFALAGVARAGAIRSNYHSSKLFLAIAGTHVGTGRADPATGVLDDSLSVTDTLGEIPNTASCTVHGVTPVLGAEVIVTLGSKNNLTREFGGSILRARHVSLTSNQRTNDGWALFLIDYTWGLNRRVLSGHYTGSASTIAASLIATATGYTASVEAGLPTVDGGITFTFQTLPQALTQLAKRAGANWVCDYQKVVHFGLDLSTLGTPPVILNAVHRSLAGFAHTTDLSQIVTRVLVEGGGGGAFANVAIGETILPVTLGDWYDVFGGVVVCGPQRIAYVSRSLGGGGGLVGPGAAPTGVPVLALASGSGIESGAHSYAVTFVTGAGESLPSPLASITVGTLAAPLTAPTAGTPTIGSGPDVGSHEYALTFVTAAGETTEGPRVTRATSETATPGSAPTPGTPTPGAGPDAGGHEYAASFVTSAGETLTGPISGTVTTGGVLAVPDRPQVGAPTAGGSVTVGSHEYAVALVTAAGETTPSTRFGVAVNNVLTAPAFLGSGTYLGGSMEGGERSWGLTCVDGNGGETTAGTLFVGTVSPAYGVRWDISLGPSGTVARKVYRTVAGGSQLKLVATIPNNTATTVDDTGSDAALGANVPTSNTTGGKTLPVSAIPIGPSGTTARKLYRTTAANPSGTLLLLATIANNSTTIYSDTIADGSLGAAAPSTNTAVVSVVPLTGIPIGDANVTSRKLYRRSGGAGLKLLTTIANNTTTTYTDTTPNASLGAAPLSVSTATVQRIPLSALALGGPLVTSRKLWGTAAGGSQLKLVATLNTTDTTYLVTTTDASLGANVPTSNTATANQVALSGIPIGAAAVTSRKIYRTPVGSAQLKLQQTIADNTSAVGVTDSTADASLGANVPTSDASGLQQPSGQVLAGATSLVVAGTGAFSASGGWAVIGNGEQVIRYTGVTGSSLTGIPSSGPGAIVASIGYNSTVTASPALLGIPASGAGSILYAILKGDDVNLLETIDDVPAQTALAALIGGDGIQEEYVQDRRLAKAEARARGTAILALKRDVDAAISFSSRDLNARAGRTQAVNLGPPFNVTGAEFLIQSVTETFSQTRPQIPPTFQVEASSQRLTFEQLLQMAQR